MVIDDIAETQQPKGSEYHVKPTTIPVTQTRLSDWGCYLNEFYEWYHEGS